MNNIPQELQLVGSGILLREWTKKDLPTMVELFSDPEIAYRTPLTSPFDLPAARDYLKTICQTRAEGKRIDRPCSPIAVHPAAVCADRTR